MCSILRSVTTAGQAVMTRSPPYPQGENITPAPSEKWICDRQQPLPPNSSPQARKPANRGLTAQDDRFLQARGPGAEACVLEHDDA
jgi:hypothetical protein